MKWLLYLALLPQLGAEDFRVREKIDRLMEANLDAAIDALKLGENSADAEIRVRCRRLVTLWFSRHADELVNRERPPGWDFWPSLEYLTEWEGSGDTADCIRCQFYDLAAARQRLFGFLGIPLENEEWVWRSATRLWLRERIAARLPFRQLLGDLCELHRAWCEVHKQPVPPPYSPRLP